MNALRGAFIGLREIQIVYKRIRCLRILCLQC